MVMEDGVVMGEDGRARPAAGQGESMEGRPRGRRVLKKAGMHAGWKLLRAE